MVEVMKIMGPPSKSLMQALLLLLPPTLQQATAEPCLCRDSWTLTSKSGSVSFGVTAPFSWVLVCTMFCLCPPGICFPSPVEILWSDLTGLQSQIPWGFSVPLLDFQVGKSVVGPRTSAIV